jgi:hypothetical protein
MDMPLVPARLKDIGVMPASAQPRSPAYLQKFVERAIETWSGPIKASGATAQ